MPIEQWLVFLVLFGLSMLQLLRRALQARFKAGHEAEPGEEVPFSEPGPDEEPSLPSPTAPPPVAFPILQTVAQPKPIVAARPVRPPVRHRQEAQPSAYASAAQRRDLLPRDRSELRRAIAQMAILGPPRALEPK